MLKNPKKFLTILTAAALSFCALSLPACSSFTALEGDYSGDVSSNGGFVVEKGNYYYFINGVETYTSDNTYGTPVKGALMRISKTDLAAQQNTAEIVVPSLMVASDYTSGIYIYGDRVYYATPNNVRNTSGETENTYLLFQSAKLDGTDIESYFTVSDNSTVYRYVEVDDTVYILYEADNDDGESALQSYNTETTAHTVLASGMGAYVLNSSDPTDPYVYYTMGVTVDIDVDGGSLSRSYNQIYRVRADATEAPYEYTYDEEYLEDNDGEEPYTNLGEIVLDGIGALYQDSPTQFTHDLITGITPESYAGYSYTLLSYNNNGLYFTRSDLATTDTTGETGWLYYLSEDTLGDYLVTRAWNSILGNDSSRYLDVIAQSTDYANSSAVFYLDDDGHHYIYIDGSNMFRADVAKDASGKYSDGTATTTVIARDVSGATLMYLDSTSDPTYNYIYYTNSGTTGYTVNRAVYNGEEEDYKILNYSDSEPYQPVQVLDVEHASDWYNYEVVDGRLFFADTQAFSDTSYNYIASVDLTTDSGALMNNVELSEFNAKYEEIMGGDDEDGYLSDLSEDYANLADAIEYYFYMGSDTLYYRENEDFEDDYFTSDGYLLYEYTYFYTNIQDAVDEGKKETYLYSTEEQDLFAAWINGTGDAAQFVDENGASYRTRGYFVTRIGLMSEDDMDTLESYWLDYLQSYTASEDESTIPTWGWVLIGVGIGVVVIGIALAIFFVVRARKKRGEDEEEEDLLFVDTTDDEDVDVYSGMHADASEEDTAEEDEDVSEDDGEYDEDGDGEE